MSKKKQQAVIGINENFIIVFRIFNLSKLVLCVFNLKDIMNSENK